MHGLFLIGWDIVDIKPANMEELTEVITAAEFHPHECNLFVYSSSKGTIRLCDMREQALCDKHAKCKSNSNGSIKGNSSKIFSTGFWYTAIVLKIMTLV